MISAAPPEQHPEIPTVILKFPTVILSEARNPGSSSSAAKSEMPRFFASSRTVARASRPPWHGHPARARERDAPATAAETPAPRPAADGHERLESRDMAPPPAAEYNSQKLTADR